MNKRQLKNALLVKSGIATWKREKNRTPRVLFYHGVSDVKKPFVEGLHVIPEVFRKHLDYLQKYYEPISMDEYARRWETQTFTGKEITLTLDDGYKNNLLVAAPILQEYGMPFTVFVSTRHIDTGKRFSTFIGRAIVFHPGLSHLHLPEIGLDCPLGETRQRKKTFQIISRQLKHSDLGKVEQITESLIGHLSPEEYQQLCQEYQADSLMTWEEVAALKKHYDCTIGSHCLDHFICDTFQEEHEIQKQIAESKKVIEEKLGQPCHYLAYPNGNTCETALKAAEQSGYRLAFTTNNKRLTPQTSPFAMPRYGVNFDLNSFMADLAFKPR